MVVQGDTRIQLSAALERSPFIYHSDSTAHENLKTSVSMTGWLMRKWFDVKLLADINGDNEKPMVND